MSLYYDVLGRRASVFIIRSEVLERDIVPLNIIKLKLHCWNYFDRLF